MDAQVTMLPVATDRQRRPWAYAVTAEADDEHYRTIIKRPKFTESLAPYKQHYYMTTICDYSVEPLVDYLTDYKSVVALWKTGSVKVRSMLERRLSVVRDIPTWVHQDEELSPMPYWPRDCPLPPELTHFIFTGSIKFCDSCAIKFPPNLQWFEATDLAVGDATPWPASLVHLGANIDLRFFGKSTPARLKSVATWPWYMDKRWNSDIYRNVRCLRAYTNVARSGVLNFVEAVGCKFLKHLILDHVSSGYIELQGLDFLPSLTSITSGPNTTTSAPPVEGVVVKSSRGRSFVRYMANLHNAVMGDFDGYIRMYCS